MGAVPFLAISQDIRRATARPSPLAPLSDDLFQCCTHTLALQTAPGHLLVGIASWAHQSNPPPLALSERRTLLSCVNRQHDQRPDHLANRNPCCWPAGPVSERPAPRTGPAHKNFAALGTSRHPPPLLSLSEHMWHFPRSSFHGFASARGSHSTPNRLNWAIFYPKRRQTANERAVSSEAQFASGF